MYDCETENAWISFFELLKGDNFEQIQLHRIPLSDGISSYIYLTEQSTADQKKIMSGMAMLAMQQYYSAIHYLLRGYYLGFLNMSHALLKDLATTVYFHPNHPHYLQLKALIDGIGTIAPAASTYMMDDDNSYFEFLSHFAENLRWNEEFNPNICRTIYKDVIVKQFLEPSDVNRYLVPVISNAFEQALNIERNPLEFVRNEVNDYLQMTNGYSHFFLNRTALDNTPNARILWETLVDAQLSPSSMNELFPKISNNTSVEDLKRIISQSPCLYKIGEIKSIRTRQNEFLWQRRLDALARLIYTELQYDTPCIAIALVDGQLHVSANDPKTAKLFRTLPERLHKRLKTLSELAVNAGNEPSRHLIFAQFKTIFPHQSEETLNRLTRDFLKVYFKAPPGFAIPTQTVKIHIYLKQVNWKEGTKHAERNLVDHLAKQYHQLPLVIGINKLCCWECTQYVKKHAVTVRGSHSMRFANVAGEVGTEPVASHRPVGKGDDLPELSNSDWKSHSSHALNLSGNSTLHRSDKLSVDPIHEEPENKLLPSINRNWVLALSRHQMIFSAWLHDVAKDQQALRSVLRGKLANELFVDALAHTLGTNKLVEILVVSNEVGTTLLHEEYTQSKSTEFLKRLSHYISVEELLKIRDKYGNSLSAYPVFAKDISSLQSLKEMGVDLDKPVTESGKTLLQLACLDGGLEILKSGTSGPEDEEDLQAGYALPNENLVAWLLQQGAEPQKTDEEGNTSLHFAAVTQSIPVMELLLSRNVAVDKKTKAGMTPLLTLISADTKDKTLRLAAVKLLLARGANPDIRPGKAGVSAIELAIIQDDAELLALLLVWHADPNRILSSGYSPIAMACNQGSIHCVKELLKVSADLELISERQPSPPLIKAILSRREEIIRLLIKKGARINTVGIVESSPLFCAAQEGLTDTVNLLLMKGADATVPNQYKRTPLWVAAHNGHLATVKLLLRSNPRLADVPDVLGNSPLLAAAECGYPAVIRLLMTQPVALDRCNQSGASALSLLTKHKTANSELRAIASLLLEKEPQLLNKPDKQGYTPIFWAMADNNLWLFKLILKKQHSLIHSIAPTGYSLLYVAALANSFEIAELMLNEGIKIENPAMLWQLIDQLTVIKGAEKMRDLITSRLMPEKNRQMMMAPAPSYKLSFFDPASNESHTQPVVIIEVPKPPQRPLHSLG